MGYLQLRYGDRVWNVKYCHNATTDLSLDSESNVLGGQRWTNLPMGVERLMRLLTNRCSGRLSAAAGRKGIEQEMQENVFSVCVTDPTLLSHEFPRKVYFACDSRRRLRFWAIFEGGMGRFMGIQSWVEGFPCAEVM